MTPALDILKRHRDECKQHSIYASIRESLSHRYFGIAADRLADVLTAIIAEIEAAQTASQGEKK
jgi:hypothetical protein